MDRLYHQFPCQDFAGATRTGEREREQMALISNTVRALCNSVYENYFVYNKARYQSNRCNAKFAPRGTASSLFAVLISFSRMKRRLYFAPLGHKLIAPAVLLLCLEGGSIVEHVLGIGFHPKFGEGKSLHVERGGPFGQANLGLHGIP